MMQVENRLSSGLRPVLQSTPLNAKAPVSNVANAATRQTSNFPDAPLISSQPLRYNVQLNQQLTRVQQADHFLQATETQLLKVNHAISRRGDRQTALAETQTLQSLLAQRQTLSGGSVNRQLHVSLEGKSQVNFQLRDGQALVNNPQPELLTFSLAGQQREISAAAIAADSTPQQTLLSLNKALGKWGIHGKLDAQREVQFQVDEQHWSRVNQHLSVQGGGERYPHSQFFPIKPQAETTLEDEVARVLANPAQLESLQPALDSTLEQLTHQRKQLVRTKALVQQRIDSMSNFSSARANSAAQDVAQQLGQRNYGSVADALGAQANVPRATVKNVLGSAALLRA
ncbi:hypothetical protein K5Y32_18905 [Pantoea sp. DY-15]|uniref:hypothetical protein n=1 Tax=unclassified Pantoea TaxID=2630326 RepID=UPI001C949BCE|nr:MULTISPECIES: hypothetical protein [unclassified Pantoea]MBY4838423.1 hypothetical protein [Pantoea sp. DY-5]MBY4890015.1 hypothetical protein [Pantoea sp. DY-15]